MLTLLVASLTETSAVLGDPSLMEPRLAFWIAPAPMETLPVVAPFMRATGMPPMRAQAPPHRLLETESRFPPDPPKATRAPPMLACDPPLTANRGSLSRDSMLPLRKLTRSPATLSTLPPPTLTSAPMATARRLASMATSDEAEERRLAPLRRMASVALVSMLPFLKWSRGAVASRSAVSTWSTWLVVTVAPSDSKRDPAVLSGKSVASIRPLSTRHELVLFLEAHGLPGRLVEPEPRRGREAGQESVHLGLAQRAHLPQARPEVDRLERGEERGVGRIVRGAHLDGSRHGGDLGRRPEVAATRLRPLTRHLDHEDGAAHRGHRVRRVHLERLPRLHLLLGYRYRDLARLEVDGGPTEILGDGEHGELAYRHHRPSAHQHLHDGVLGGVDTVALEDAVLELEGKRARARDVRDGGLAL